MTREGAAPGMISALTRAALGASLVAVLSAGSLAAQEPAAPPPSSSEKSGARPEVHDLLPDLGRIGSEVGIVVGASWKPYAVGRGFAIGGFLDVPPPPPGLALRAQVYDQVPRPRALPPLLRGRPRHGGGDLQLLRQAITIEQAAQDAYTALISQIRTRDYLLSAAFILVDEVRHTTVWRRVLGLRIY
jgi:hypothetical protein